MNASTNDRKPTFHVEESLPDGSYQVLWRGDNYDEGRSFMIENFKVNRLELDSHLWRECAHGYAPMESIGNPPKFND